MNNKNEVGTSINHFVYLDKMVTIGSGVSCNKAFDHVVEVNDMVKMTHSHVPALKAISLSQKE